LNRLILLLFSIFPRFVTLLVLIVLFLIFFLSRAGPSPPSPAAGRFREDLYYRLNVVTIHLPPLRERREDIPMLVDHFLSRYTTANRSAITGVSAEAMKVLCEYAWPGNVRELENVIERLVVNAKGPQVEVSDLSSDVRAQDTISFKPRRKKK